MYRGWPFFATTLESAAMALAKADLGVARLYLSASCPSPSGPCLTGSRRSTGSTVALLEAVFQAPLLHNQKDPGAPDRPHGTPTWTPSTSCRWSFSAATAPPGGAEDEALKKALLLSILGVAAGLRNAG
jgi:phosphoenolpyruvate carboxylase